jgi:hypothetical protein
MWHTGHIDTYVEKFTVALSQKAMWGHMTPIDYLFWSGFGNLAGTWPGSCDGVSSEWKTEHKKEHSIQSINNSKW